MSDSTTDNSKGIRPKQPKAQRGRPKKHSNDDTSAVQRKARPPKRRADENDTATSSGTTTSNDTNKRVKLTAPVIANITQLNDDLIVKILALTIITTIDIMNTTHAFVCRTDSIMFDDD
jgi:hypothetical protein